MVASNGQILEDRSGAAIEIQGVSHAFDLAGGMLSVIDRVDLSIEPGSFVALLGASGCGKSTLLRLVAGLEAPRQGRILFDGEPIDGPGPSRIVVFQDPTLYPWRTVRANVALGLEARGLVKRQGRAELARALVNEPRLLILDEPLGKLDSLTRLGMQAELVNLWQREQFTALMVTHDVEEALVMAERVIVLSDRPARITADIRIDQPYPRHRDGEALVALRREVLGLLGVGS